MIDPPNDGKIYLRRNGQWVVGGGAPYSKHYCQVYVSPTTVFAARNVWKTIPYDTVVADESSIYNSSTGVFTAAEAGIWFAGGTISTKRATNRGFTNKTLCGMVKSNGENDYLFERYVGSLYKDDPIHWLGWLDKNETLYFRVYLGNDDLHIYGNAAGTHTAMAVYMVSS